MQCDYSVESVIHLRDQSIDLPSIAVLLLLAAFTCSKEGLCYVTRVIIFNKTSSKLTIPGGGALIAKKGSNPSSSAPKPAPASPKPVTESSPQAGKRL